jgi:hypothetical protein
MSSIEVGAIVTTIIGILWIVLAGIFHAGDPTNTINNVIAGVVVSAAGLLTAIAARWWENDR